MLFASTPLEDGLTLPSDEGPIAADSAAFDTAIDAVIAAAASDTAVVDSPQPDVASSRTGALDEKPRWVQVAILTFGELAFAVIAIPRYLFLVLPKYPKGSLPGFSPVIAEGVDPLLAVVGAIGVLALSLGLIAVLSKVFGYERLNTDESEMLIRGFDIIELVPIFAAAGFAEEFLFRTVFADAFGLIVSAILFTVAHASYWKKPLMLVDVFAIALLLGAFYLFTKSLLLCAVVHCAYNLLLAIFVKRGWIPGSGSD